MYRYIGKGAFLPGVPMADLSDEEATAYGVQASPLYERVPEPLTREGRGAPAVVETAEAEEVTNAHDRD